MNGYYYLHTNGNLIYKNAYVVDSDPDYFDSPFVKKWWRFDSTERQNAWAIMLESLASGLNISRAKELSTKWGLTITDFYEFMMRNTEPPKLQKDGIVLFAEKVMGMPEDEFFDKVREVNQSVVVGTQMADALDRMIKQ